MRFQISAPDSAAQGLRVIPLIPDHPLIRIEGQNGIGKTLAARLLELVSGEQPFAAFPHAWESLVELLGKVSIIIDEIPGGEIITCQLDSSDWFGREQV